MFNAVPTQQPLTDVMMHTFNKFKKVHTELFCIWRETNQQVIVEVS